MWLGSSGCADARRPRSTATTRGRTRTNELPVCHRTQQSRCDETHGVVITLPHWRVATKGKGKRRGKTMHRAKRHGNQRGARQCRVKTQDLMGHRARPLRRLTSSTHKRLCSSVQRQLPRPPSPIVALVTPACSAMPTAHMPMQKNPSPPKRFGGPKGVSGGHQGRHVPQMIGGQEGPRGKEGKGTLPGGRPHRTHAPPTSSPPIPTLRKDSGASNTQK